MRKELREKILAYNKAVKEKVSDMDIMIAALAKMPPGQLKKVLTEEVMVVLAKYGVK